MNLSPEHPTEEPPARTSLGYASFGLTTRPPLCIASVIALILVLSGFPVGTGISLGIGRKTAADAAYADPTGLAVVILMAASGTAIAWRARRQIQQSDNRLGGLTTATVAMTFGCFVLLACLIAIVRPGLP